MKGEGEKFRKKDKAIRDYDTKSRPRPQIRGQLLVCAISPIRRIITRSKALRIEGETPKNETRAALSLFGIVGGKVAYTRRSITQSPRISGLSNIALLLIRLDGAPSGKSRDQNKEKPSTRVKSAAIVTTRRKCVCYRGEYRTKKKKKPEGGRRQGHSSHENSCLNGKP